MAAGGPFSDQFIYLRLLLTLVLSLTPAPPSSTALSFSFRCAIKYFPFLILVVLFGAPLVNPNSTRK